jgi:hypothetical protein
VGHVRKGAALIQVGPDGPHGGSAEPGWVSGDLLRFGAESADRDVRRCTPRGWRNDAPSRDQVVLPQFRGHLG